MSLESNFKFASHPQLNKEFNKFRSLKNKTYKLSAKDSNAFPEAVAELEEYAYGKFAQSIYEIFAPIKPILRNRRKGGSFQWDEVFDKPFAELSLSQKKYLVGLIEGSFVYLLPEEYYNE